jgi:hypothetical protein
MVTQAATEITAKVVKNANNRKGMKDCGGTACLHQSYFSSNGDHILQPEDIHLNSWPLI